MEKFTVAEEEIPAGYTAKSYDELLTDIQDNLIKVHEHTCASGDMYESLAKITQGQVSSIAGKSVEINYHVMTILENTISLIKSADKNADLVLNRTIQTRSRVWSWKKVATWIALGAVATVVTMGAGWVVGVKTGSLVGYSRAFDDLASGGMIEIKRHGDWVDLTMGPSNPAGRGDPARPKSTMRLEADKVPDLR
jgi:hypothetical protein